MRFYPTCACFCVLFFAHNSSAHHTSGQQEQITVTGHSTNTVSHVSTATRTTTQDKFVPQTINSVNAEELTAFSQPTLSEALVGIPGVNAINDTRFDGVTIRGFNSSNDFYLDGFRDDMQYTRDLTNTERIEILKGPAAVLYGRGSGGGIINRISKKPHIGQPSSLTVQAGSYSFKRLQTDLNAQAGDNLLFRFNAGKEIKNSFRHQVKGDRLVLAPSISWQPLDSLNWLLQYEYQKNKRTPDRGIPGVNGRPASVDIHQLYSDPQRDFINDTVQTLRSRLTYDINYQWQLRQMFSFTQLHSTFDNTYVTSVRADKANRARWQQDLHTRNIFNAVELQGEILTGPFEHRVLLGIEHSFQTRTPILYQNKNPVAAQDLYQPQHFLPYQGPMKLSSDNHHRVRGSALYIQDQLSSDNWHLLAGLRYDRFHVTSNQRHRGRQESRDNNNISPRVGLVYTPLPEHAFYVSWSKSYLPTGGGLIGITPDNRNNVLPPEQIRQYETGIKSDWLNRRLQTTLSVYRLEMYNRRTADPENPGVVRLTGLQRTDGIELTMTASITDAIYLRGGIAVQNARLVKAEKNLQGKRPSNVSHQNGSLYIGYRHPQGWFGETGVTAVSQRYADNQNTTLLPGYYKIDARAGYRWRKWRVQVSAENLLDQRYYVSATSAAQIMPGATRQFSAMASYQF